MPPSFTASASVSAVPWPATGYASSTRLPVMTVALGGTSSEQMKPFRGWQEDCCHAKIDAPSSKRLTTERFRAAYPLTNYSPDVEIEEYCSSRSDRTGSGSSRMTKGARRGRRVRGVHRRIRVGSVPGDGGAVDLGDEGASSLRRGGRGRRGGPHDQDGTGRQHADPVAHQVPQPPGDAVPHDRWTHRLAHHQTDPWGTEDRPTSGRWPELMQGQQGATGTLAAANGSLEIAVGTQAVRGREHRRLRGAGLSRGCGPRMGIDRPASHRCGTDAQADSSSRPLRRRPARIARPARVRIRSRKPWVLARRRLFGWKVRLLMPGLHGLG